MSKKFLVGILDVAIEVAAVAVGYYLGGPFGAELGAAIGGIAVQGANSLLLKSPKPPQAYESIKTERPVRFSAYAINRLAPIVIPHI